MLATDAGFLEAICADPADTSVRLIYADWLQEHGGNEYAEFIRVQVELADLEGRMKNLSTGEVKPLRCDDKGHWLTCPDTEKCEALRRREAELLEHNWMAWAGQELLRFVNFYGRRGAPAFRRGFVEVVECRCDQWMEHGPAIVRRQPVREVRLSDIAACVEEARPHDVIMPILDLLSGHPLANPRDHRPDHEQPYTHIVVADSHGRLCGFASHKDFAKAFNDMALVWARGTHA